VGRGLLRGRRFDLEALVVPAQPVLPKPKMVGGRVPNFADVPA